MCHQLQQLPLWINLRRLPPQISKIWRIVVVFSPPNPQPVPPVLLSLRSLRLNPRFRPRLRPSRRIRRSLRSRRRVTRPSCPKSKRSTIPPKSRRNSRKITKKLQRHPHQRSRRCNLWKIWRANREMGRIPNHLQVHQHLPIQNTNSTIKIFLL